MKIIVDVDVWNCQIRAARPDMQIAMPTTDVGKLLFWNTAPLDRINKRKYGWLKGKAYKKALKVVEQNGAINISGEYGSIEIDEDDFDTWVEA